MPDTPLNPDGIEAGAKALYDHFKSQAVDNGETWQEWEELDELGHEVARDDAEAAVSAYIAVAQPEVTSAVEAFINERPGYITALKNTRGTDDQSDYWRWQGHAESRRQLAQALGWTVPHNPGETTRPEVEA